MHEKDEEEKKLLETARVIAVVGLSPDTEAASNIVARYLMAHGYRVIPVNRNTRRCWRAVVSLPLRRA
jgi:predicted CoA-binding protein